jgi:hypothetical protein
MRSIARLQYTQILFSWYDLLQLILFGDNPSTHLYKALRMYGVWIWLRVEQNQTGGALGYLFKKEGWSGKIES